MFRFRLLQRSFSTSTYLRNAAKSAAQTTAEATQKQTIQSSCPAGTILNLKIKKSGAEPVALEDSEYPEWLWTVLDPKQQQAKLEQDPAKLAKKEMRNRNKKQIKLNNFMKQMK